MFESAAAFARDAEALPIKFLLRGSFTESAPLIFRIEKCPFYFRHEMGVENHKGFLKSVVRDGNFQS